MSELSGSTAKLADHKTRLLDLLFKEEQRKRRSSTAIPRRDKNAKLVLSYAQAGIWFLEQLGNLGTAYHLPAAVRLTGYLDDSALERALHAVVARHEVLRTRFAISHGQPIQVIDGTDSFRLDRADISHLTAEARDMALRQLAQSEAQRPFDLANGPLFRVKLARLADKDNAFFICMHHLIADGWSIGIIIREIVALYHAYSRGLPSPLASLPVQYADYAIWQRERLDQEGADQHIEYWRRRLENAPPALDLLTDRARPRAPTFDGGTVRFSLPADLVRSLHDLVRSEGATLYMLLLAAYQLLLSRHSGQNEIVVGSPISDRSRSDLEGLVGLFLNTVVMRTDLSGNPTFRELLRRVKDVALEAYAHQGVPFERIVHDLHPIRDPSRHPIFQAALTLQNMPEESPALPGLTLTPISSRVVNAKIDLSLLIREGQGGCYCELEYMKDLFDRETAEQLAGHFKTLLHGIVGDPDCRILQLPLLRQSERQALLGAREESNDFPNGVCIYEVFEQQVLRTPEATALVFGDERLTFAELDDRANRLARHLRGLGAGPEVVVGLCIERSIEMIVGMIGIWKAGAAVLPLDPGYPRKRLDYLLADSAALICLTTSKSVDRISSFNGTVVDLDLSPDWKSRQEIAKPIAVAEPENLAYIVYTSGTTGRPKGVMVTHASFVNAILATIRKFSLEASTRVLEFIPPGFDASIWEIFMTLCSGATLYVVPRETLLSPPNLISFIQVNSINVLAPSPSILALLPSADLPSVRLIHTGGEVVSPELAARWSSGRSFYNVYAPTEATAATTWYLAERASSGAQHVPIGTAVDNVELYVLDRLGELTPIGLPGELYIGGAGVARGYLQRPELTSEKFVPNPFNDRAGERLYRTGDRVARQRDGNLVFLGRLDRQVKLRGIRIEPMEIESVLMRHPDIAMAAVVVRKIAEEDRLIAYVVAAAGRSIDIPRLMTFVKDNLPAHLRPAGFVNIEAMPKTASGKVNLDALPPFLDRLDHNASPPETDLEIRVAKIWSEVLGVRQASLADNFFESGGSSLSAIKLYLKLSSELKIDLPLRSIMEASDLSALVGEIEEVFARETTALGGVSPEEPGLVRAVRTRRTADPSAEYRNDVKLDRSIQPLAGTIVQLEEARAVLLTGITGFIGAFTTRSLLERTDAQIFCPVRAQSVQERRARVDAMLAACGVTSRELLERVVPLSGDLGRPQLGLCPADYEKMSVEADAIFHCGRMSNFVLPYENHRAVNVDATTDVIQLAATIRPKSVHLASTMLSTLRTGYEQSRWVAEQLVADAHQRGFHVAVYRAGRLAGDTRTGAFPPGHFVGALVKGCVELGCAPHFKGLEVDLTPVDYVSECIVSLAARPDAFGKAFAVCHPEFTKWSTIVEGLRAFGYSLEVSSPEAWRGKLRATLDENALAPFWSVLEDLLRPPRGRSSAPDEMPEAVALTAVDARSVHHLVERTGIACPSVDHRLIGHYLATLVRTGYLPKPQTLRMGVDM